MASVLIGRRTVLTQAVAIAVGSGMVPAFAAPMGPSIAFTFDDPKTASAGAMAWTEINRRMLSALEKHRIKSILFVCGMRVDSKEGHDLVAQWNERGHQIGNHSYSHHNLDTTPLAQFQADAIAAEPQIASFSQFSRMFRYPFFKEGNTALKRDGMRLFLKERGYRIGRATIDASDWAISARMERRMTLNPQADLSGYRDFFLQHIWERAQYYHALAKRLSLGEVRHTVLLHHSPLNALYLDDLITMFTLKGWRPSDAKYAYEDPVYDRQPDALPAGESLVWALAKETGRFDSELRYPGEDDVYENPRMDALSL